VTPRGFSPRDSDRNVDNPAVGGELRITVSAAEKRFPCSGDQHVKDLASLQFGHLRLRRSGASSSPAGRPIDSLSAGVRRDPFRLRNWFRSRLPSQPATSCFSRGRVSSPLPASPSSSCPSRFSMGRRPRDRKPPGTLLTLSPAMRAVVGALCLLPRSSSLIYRSAFLCWA